MPADLPSGTVTFLFTDVEGSTALLERLGEEDYGRELGRHRDIVREALAGHGGVEVDTQGDAFFCAFGSARAAVACAAEIQEQLAATRIRARMGVHTGEALVVDRHYVGMDVHCAARIAACGHGGQVVLSPATVALLESDVELRELGAHRLKDLAAPVVLHQIGREEFPPLRTLYRTNLPIPATPFLGRESELAELVALASQAGVRALTLTGSGGTGKTRLSLQLAGELADAYPDGLWWVALAPLRGGHLVASAVAAALDVEEAGGSPVEAIAASLAAKRLLLLLDNCEHVIDAVADIVSALVARCPELLVVATSREPLAVTGEHVYPVLPLDASDAFELFHARARAVGGSLDRDATRDVVTTLCSRLDNLPLAVELAAARTQALPPAALLERLSARLDVLSGPRDAEERQRTLRAAIAWSYELLSDAERQLFRRLGVFVGGASLSVIEEVCEADLNDLLSVAAKSLVRQTVTDDGEPRYWMLETIREFAVAELSESGELGALRERHLALFARLADAAGDGLQGAESGQWLTRVERDLANLRAAFEHALEVERADRVAALAIALSIRHFSRGRYSEVEAVTRQALARDLDVHAAVELYDWLAKALRVQGRPLEALEAFRAAERTLERLPERDDVWWSRWIGVRLDEATFFYFENLQHELTALIAELEPLVADRGTPEQQLDMLHLRCQHAYRRERYAPSDETEALVREAYHRALERDDVSADFMLGFCLLWRGKLDEALECFIRGREVAQSRGLAIIETRCLVYGLVATRRLGDVEGARERLAELEAQDELHGYRGLVSASASWLAYRDGNFEDAVARASEALADWSSPGRTGSSVFEWAARFPLLGVAVVRGDLAGAREHAVAMLDESQQPLPDRIAAALQRGEGDGYVAALELARANGYA